MNSIKGILIWTLCLPLFCIGQFYNTEVEASIELEVLDNSIFQITASAYNKTEINKSLRYNLSVIKGDKNSNNKSSNNQEGRFVLNPGVKKNLSNTSINVQQDTRTIILLLIYDEEDKIIGKDRKIFNGLEHEEDNVNKPMNKVAKSDVEEGENDGFILKGMVIENTKTKAGGDFYDLFYSSYLAQNIDGEKIVKIDEKLGIASTTQIQVVVGDDIVLQFMLNPRNQYLQTMANQAIYRVNQYFQKLRNRKNEIIRY